MKKADPTSDFYTFFNMIYDYYNQYLFEGDLPNCMFVITRRKDIFGYYIPKRWINNEKIKSDEIALNPLMFGSFPLTEILKTLVHEMCHLWQHNLGTPSQRTYHNKEWGDKMESIGLMPSNTGKPGGKKTGQQMMEYVIKDGDFHTYSEKLIQRDVFKKLWFDSMMPPGITNEYILEIFQELDEENEAPTIRRIEGPTNEKSKVKYSCPVCDYNVWGKSGLSIRCNECKTDYEEVKKV